MNIYTAYLNQYPTLFAVKNNTRPTKATERTYWYWFVGSTASVVYYRFGVTQQVLLLPFIFIALGIDVVLLIIHFMAWVENERFEHILKLEGKLLVYQVIKYHRLPFILNQIFKIPYGKKAKKIIEHRIYEVKYMSLPDKHEEDPLLWPFRVHTPDAFNDLATLSFTHVKGPHTKEVFFDHFPKPDVELIHARIEFLLQVI